jgi:membrane protease YdiL (CAAX protease family)
MEQVQELAISRRLEKLPVSTWTIKDVLLVIFFVFVISVVFYITLLELVGDNKTTFRLARYVTSLLTLFLPLLWIKKKYGLSKEALGLRKGHLKLSLLVLIGIGTALIYSLLVRLTPLWQVSILTNLKVSNYYISLIFLPLSIDGFANIILTPISEEVMDRGFIYGYLRRKLGLVFGLILKALFFSLSHLGYIYGDMFYLIGSRFLIGLVLGILYETTGSIYSSIVFHSVFNYFIIIMMFL